VAGSEPCERVRLDVWLDVACLYKTRSEAQRACKSGKVLIGGQRVKPHREVRPGDEIVITRALGRRQHVVVRGLAERHVARDAARKLYEDRTPPPSPQEQELADLLRLTRPVRPKSAGTPGKRDRRLLRQMKERG
jgi:ribosome-associated heat shock protein Hsp15